ncbi:DNA polymerase III subunit delta [Mycoplasmopsis lipofaciens]|uniref:DNA polymerase III subunit delta n=1 Tax=Mycoplasmopsis lipofaciens TaxID=114884 RepID=UPI0004866F75|nr:hypothetical protein [Mycoplasmopsis lipofaciens]
MYFIYGSEKYFIKQKINEIINKNANKKLVTFYYDDNNEIMQLLDIVMANDLFSSERIIIIYDLPFFEKQISKDDKGNINILIKYLQNNTKDTIVFVNQDLINKNKIVKNELTNFLFKEVANKVISVETKSISANDLVNEICVLAKKNGGSITQQAALLLSRKVPNDLYLINIEINKLLNQNKQINEKMVEESVSDIYTEDVFGFSNSFESNDLNTIWRKYKEKSIEGVDISILIAQTSQIFILANQIYGYKMINKSLFEISKELKIHEFRVKKVSYLLNKYGINKIKQIILSLALLDEEIKEGKINPKIGFERFLIKFFI